MPDPAHTPPVPEWVEAVERVRGMLIMDFAGFPGQHYIGSAERIVASLDHYREAGDRLARAVEEFKNVRANGSQPGWQIAQDKALDELWAALASYPRGRE